MIEPVTKRGGGSIPVRDESAELRIRRPSALSRHLARAKAVRVGTIAAELVGDTASASVREWSACCVSLTIAAWCFSAVRGAKWAIWQPSGFGATGWGR